MPYANIKGADQPAHPRSLISAFVFRYLDSIIPLLAMNEANLCSISIIIEPHCDKTNKMACVPSEDSDQPGHLRPAKTQISLGNINPRAKKPYHLTFLLDQTQNIPYCNVVRIFVRLFICFVN